MEGRKPRASVLVIDDEKVIRDGCKRILEGENLSVKTARDGEEGLQFIRMEPFDVLLLDLMMPGLSGLEVLRRIPEIQPDLTVIVITGYATVENAVEAMKQGAYDFIAKPFSADQLRLIVYRALEKRALMREAELLRTERERNLKEIAAEKQRTLTILQKMDEGVLVTDLHKRIVLCNAALGRMLEIDTETIIGKSMEAAIPSRDLVELVEQAMKVKEPEWISKKGLFLRAHSTPVRDKAGGLIGCVAVIEDISHLTGTDQLTPDLQEMVPDEIRSRLSVVYRQIRLLLEALGADPVEK